MFKAVVLDNYIICDIFSMLTDKHIDVVNLYDGMNPVSGLTHGTICAAIFSEFSRVDNLVGVSLGNKNSEVDTDGFVRALRWCLDNKVDLISMSLGTVDFIELGVFASLVEELIDAGTVIVAAGSNSGKITYPASLPRVIGVKSTGLLHSGAFVINTNARDGIDIASSLPDSHVVSVLRDIFEDFTGEANSLVTPYIAGLIARSISDNGNNRASDAIYNLRSTDGFSNVVLLGDKYKRNPSLPIVSINGSLEFVLDLHRRFISEEFLSSVLSPNTSTDYYMNAFSININGAEDAINAYSNLCSADIILVHNPDNRNDIKDHSDVVFEGTSSVNDCFKFLLGNFEYGV